MRSPAPVAAAGAVVIAFSAPLVRLAEVAPSTAAVFRCAYARPLLGALALAERRRHGARARRDVLLGWLAGFLFALDLTFWHHSIAAVGAGLATVLANVQVVLVGVLAWLALGERPERSSIVATPVVLLGVVLISGVVGGGAYGEDPALGAVYGLVTGLAYALFLLILRRVNRDPRRPAGPLFDATLGGAVCAAIGGLAVGDVDFLPGVESQAWLVTLAVSSQVVGWLLISYSLPRLPALVTSIVLTIQPVGSVLLGVALFGEAPSALQLTGVGLVLGGVTIATLGRQVRGEPAPEPA